MRHLCQWKIGGLGLPRLDATLVFEEMAAVDPSTTAFLTIHNMATWMVGHWGQPALREEWGPQLASGEKLASYCLTEPGAGSDALAVDPRAAPGGDYIVNGAKAFISGGGDTNLLIVMARTGGEGAAGISAFAIPPTAPASAMAARKKRWAGTASPPGPSCSRTCACRLPTCWATRATASRSP